MSINSKILLSLIYFAAVAFIGSFMRLMFVIPVNLLDYQNILHSHSHFAVLGWVFNALFISILYAYLPEKMNSAKFNLLFWFFQLSIIGMLITFALKGYYWLSIAFSTMHILLSYCFIVFIFSELRKIRTEILSLKFIYGGLFFLFLSTLGPWALVFVVMNGLSGTDLYKQAIYFYLHFQYNGWFIFSITGLWLWYFEKLGAKFNEKTSHSAFNLLFYSNITGYSLSLLGFKMPNYVWALAFISALIQLFGARKLYQLFFANEVSVFSKGGKPAQFLFRFSFLALLIKYILQLISSLPEAGAPAFLSREVTIGFIHLVMLGVVSIGIIGWLGGNELLDLESFYAKTGIRIFLLSFVITEFLLFYPALVIWFQVGGITLYTNLLFSLTVLMLLGTIMIAASKYKEIRSAG